MTDTELAALTALVNAEVSAMVWTNEQRKHIGCSMAYEDVSFTALDCCQALDAELRRRGIMPNIL